MAESESMNRTSPLSQTVYAVVARDFDAVRAQHGGQGATAVTQRQPDRLPRYSMRLIRGSPLLLWPADTWLRPASIAPPARMKAIGPIDFADERATYRLLCDLHHLVAAPHVATVDLAQQGERLPGPSSPAMEINARMSFVRQPLPNPMPALRNRHPILPS